MPTALVLHSCRPLTRVGKVVECTVLIKAHQESKLLSIIRSPEHAGWLHSWRIRRKSFQSVVRTANVPVITSVFPLLEDQWNGKAH